MKPVVANWERIVYCIRIEPLHGDIVYLVSYPVNLTMGNGRVYLSDTGYSFTGIKTGVNFGPSSIDISSLIGTSISQQDIEAGVYDNARVFAFATDWAVPVEDEEELAKGFFGQVSFVDNRYVAEIMTQIDILNQTVDDSYSATCPKKLGSQVFAGCKVDLGPLTVSGTITGVTDNLTFQDSSIADADDYFGGGLINFLTGPNADLKEQEIKIYTTGEFTLHESFPYDLAIGHTFSVVPGCRGRLEDCIGKFDNVLNFGGFPSVPTENVSQSRGTK